MKKKILLTGSEGLIGRALRLLLQKEGFEVRGLDLVGPDMEQGDVRILKNVQQAIDGCDGVIHLAAVSRVIWAEQDPQRCWNTNVGGVQNLIEAAEREARNPWILFASSREVYGQPEVLPASEDAPLKPVNIYGRSKVAGEKLFLEARTRGMQTAIVRLSNVYGTTSDHADRVVPAFARAAALGEELRVDGPDHTFDFTHIKDTCRGLLKLIQRLEEGDRDLPPIHLLTGRPTTLKELATLAIQKSQRGSRMRIAPPRSYDVSHFYGNPTRAKELLGWQAEISISEGIQRLIEDFEKTLIQAQREVAP